MIVTTINLLQVINLTVTGITSAPNMVSYPKTLDTVRLPVALPEVVDGETQRRLGFLAADYVIANRVYIQAIGQGHYGTNLVTLHTVLDAMLDVYNDSSTYVDSGEDTRRMLQIDRNIEIEQEKPLRFIVDKLLEYPPLSERFFMGFTFFLPIIEDLDSSC